MTSPTPGNVLKQLYDTRAFSDMDFLCRGECIKVHKSVVCTQSPVINAAMTGGFKESEENTVDMDAFTLETVLLFVEYLYTGSYTASTIDMKVADNSDAVGSKKNSLSKDVSENSEQELDNIQPHEVGSAKHLLSEGIRMNAIGDYYQVPGLVSMAKGYITAALTFHKHTPRLVAVIPQAIKKVEGTTGDPRIMDELAQATAVEIKDLLELKSFQDLPMVSDFSLKVMAILEKQIRRLRRRNTKRTVKTGGFRMDGLCERPICRAVLGLRWIFGSIYSLSSEDGEENIEDMDDVEDDGDEESDEDDADEEENEDDEDGDVYDEFRDREDEGLRPAICCEKCKWLHYI